MIKHAQQVAVAEQGDVSSPPLAPEIAAPEEHIAPAPRVSVQAFCETVETAAAVQAAGDDRRMAKVHLKIQMGGPTAAAEAYRGSPTPNVIILETEGHTDILMASTSSPASAIPARVSSFSALQPT